MNDILIKRDPKFVTCCKLSMLLLFSFLLLPLPIKVLLNLAKGGKEG